MKTTNFTLSQGIGASPIIVKVRTLLQSLALMATFFYSTAAYAQDPCALSCQPANVSVDMTCSALITTSMVADTSSCMSGNFSVTVLTLDDDTLETSPLVDFDQLGETLKVSVFDSVSGNSCWSTITIEDKMPPIFDSCPNDTIDCVDAENFAFPTATDNCSADEVIKVDERIDALDDPCDLDFIRKITRKFIARDVAGNETMDTCVQELFLRRIDFSQIVWPDSFVIVDGTAISCTADFPDANNDNNPDPLPVADGGTGAPTINGVPIWPDFNFACNSVTTFEDINIGPIGCVRKIMRAWTVREWHCSGERDTTYFQLIEIVDLTGPEFASCPFDIELTTGHLNCDANYALPILDVTDDCSDVQRVTVTYPGGFLDQNGGVNVDLPVGENIITYTAYDDCLNSTECSYTVDVDDITPPVPICDEHTVVGLTGYEIGGLTIIPASVLDDGSYDECSDVTFRAFRMDSCIDFDWTTDGVGEDTQPNGILDSRDRGTVARAGIPVACCDAGAPAFMVALIVTDASGNSNSCMVEVEVQDKLQPTIECPSDIVVSCEFDYDLNNLSAFGKIAASEVEREEFCVFDPGNDFDDDLDGFVCGIDGVAIDNCNLDIRETVTPIINNCGVGEIRRQFTAIDPNGNAACIQTITVRNFDPLTTQDIVFPPDFTGAECGLGTDPDDLPAPFNRPVITEDECDLVGVNYEDQVFPFVEGACFKILRTWRVIEWCLYEEFGELVPGVNFWEDTQIIKVENAFGPEFLTDQPAIEECNEVDCGGIFVELIQRADDDCTPEGQLEWNYTIDNDDNGVINFSASGTGNVIDASRTFPIGVTRVLYSFEDRCGNVTTREQFVTISSCKAPTPVCIVGLSTDLMPQGDDGMVVIWAKEFDASSEHACGLPITFSFTENPADSSRIFTCADFGTVPIRLYVHDNNGQFAYCATEIDIQDNMNVCDGNGGNLVSVGGTINTASTLDVAEVEMSLEGSELLPVITNAAGGYTFPAMPTGGTYEVVPERDGDDKNGVSVLDLVRIQKHLLGVDPFTSPYDRIAADANNSESISAIDLIELRKLILGIYDELPNNTSWRFVDKGYEFPDVFNPWFQTFPESYVVNPLNQSMTNIDFVAVKIGDLNNTVVANATQIITRNATNTLTMAIADQKVAAGNIVSIDVYADDFDQMNAMQFTLGTSNKLDFVGVESGAIEVTKESFGLNKMNKGLMTMGWFDVKPITVANDEVLFTLTFRAKSGVVLSEALSLNSKVTDAEAYNDSEEMLDLALEFRGSATELSFELMQNIPNPVDQDTKIGFKLPKAAAANLSVYDITGRLIMSVDVEAVKGYNEVTINKAQLSATGLLYYQLNTEGFTASHKMVVTQ